MHHGKPTKQSPYVPHHNQYCLVFIVVSRIVPRHVLAHDVRCSRGNKQCMDHRCSFGITKLPRGCGAYNHFIMGLFCQTETQGSPHFKFGACRMDSVERIVVGGD